MWITECMCTQGERLLFELLSDEIITDKWKMRSVILRRKLAYI